MAPTTAVLVDDRPDQLALLVRLFERAGWQIHTAIGSIAGESLAARILAGPDAAQTVILTDLHMPGDPYASAYPWAAGAYLALRLRARMEWGGLPRAPIIGLTSLLAPELREAALAFGCDAVVEKDPPLSLAARVTAVLHAHTLCSPNGLDAMLRQAQLERALVPPPAPTATVADLTAALLAYRRYGMVGLGESALARMLEPRMRSVLQRGEATYAQIMSCLDTLAGQGAGKAAAILRAELECQLTPAAQQALLARSRTGYYRLRRAAIDAVVGMLAQRRDHASSEHVLAV